MNEILLHEIYLKKVLGVSFLAGSQSNNILNKLDVIKKKNRKEVFFLEKSKSKHNCYIIWSLCARVFSENCKLRYTV